MAYTAGGTIEAWDYNRLTWGGNTSGVYTSTPSNFAYVWGVGNGQFGYGQDASAISTVSAGGTVTATQWSTFVQRLNLALAHQGGVAAQLASGSNIGIVAGATIAAFANVATAVTTVNTNNLNFNSTRGATTTGANLDGTWNSATPTTFQQVRTVTFTSADTMRYFFNAGGRINLALTTVSGTDNAKEQSWTDLLNNGIGIISLDSTTSARSGTGYTVTTNGSATGFWDLTGGTDYTLIKLTDTTAAYNVNFVEVLARVTGTAGSNGGLGTVITFTINYSDGASDTVYDAAQTVATAADQINMTMRTRIDHIKPETTYLADVVSTITIAATTN